MNIKKSILCIYIILTSTIVHGQKNDSLEVIKATEKFIKSFVGFNWLDFRKSFAKDATIFFPSWEEGKRRTGQKEIEETWLQLFPEFIDSTKKFDMKIDPKNILMQLYANTAILTFHLIPKGNYLSRRTLVFIKENDEWKIVHLHASTLKDD